MQEGDVLIFQTENGGEIEIINGITTMIGGFDSAVYLSLFGGNKNDDGTVTSRFNWWGNMVEEDPIYHYRSKFQYLLTRLVPISGNLTRLESAVLQDLQWMIDSGIANTITAIVSLIDIRKVKTTIEILADAEKIIISFLANWQAQASETL